MTVTTPEPPLVKVDGCDLCRAARITPWYHEDDICWVAECDVCDVPMVVWRFHGTEPPAEHLTHMHDRLREIATRQLGEIYVDEITCAISPITITRTAVPRVAFSATACAAQHPDRQGGHPAARTVPPANEGQEPEATAARVRLAAVSAFLSSVSVNP